MSVHVRMCACILFKAVYSSSVPLLFKVSVCSVTGVWWVYNITHMCMHTRTHTHTHTYTRKHTCTHRDACVHVSTCVVSAHVHPTHIHNDTSAIAVDNIRVVEMAAAGEVP